MTVKHVHPENGGHSARALPELNRRCLQRLRTMRAESRGAEEAPLFGSEKGRIL